MIPNDIFSFVPHFPHFHIPVGIKMSSVTLAALEECSKSITYLETGSPSNAEASIYGLKIIIDDTFLPGQYEYVYRSEERS
jgi:hypothetical protein